MCNLYSPTKGQDAIRRLAKAMRDTTGNLPTLPAIFPNVPAPVVRTAKDGLRELAMMRWGMPSPAFALKGRKTDPGVTNVRNVTSPHGRRWLGVEHRCLVPFTSFSEYEAAAERLEGDINAGDAVEDLRSNVDFPEVGDGVGGHSGLLVFEDHAVTRHAGRLRRW